MSRSRSQGTEVTTVTGAIYSVAHIYNFMVKNIKTVLKNHCVLNTYYTGYFKSLIFLIKKTYQNFENLVAIIIMITDSSP